MDGCIEAHGNRWWDRKRTRTDFLIALGLALLSTVWQALASRIWAPIEDQWSYVFADDGASLYCARQVLRGALPYRDLMYPYGPVPLYSLVPFIAWLGPVPLALQIQKLTFDFLPLFALAWIYLGFIPRRWVIAGFLLASFCYLGNQTLIHGSFEKLGTILIVGLWRPPQDRKVSRALLIGIFLAALQLVKFGGCFVMGASILVADALSLWVSRVGWQVARAWIGNLCFILLGFLAGQLGIAALAFSVLPHGYAMDAILPLFTIEWYRSYVTPAVRWPDFGSWTYFLTCPFPIILGLFGALGYLMVVIWKGFSPGKPAMLPPTVLRFLLLPVFYGLGLFIYFSHSGNVIVYGWLAVSFLPFLLYVARSLLRWGLVAALLPCGLVLPKHVLDAFREPMPADLAWRRMPNGYSVLLRDGAYARFQAVASKLQEIDRTTPGTGFVILRRGHIYHLWADIPAASRHYWTFPAIVRPYERDKVAAQFAGAKAIVELPEYQKYPDQTPAELKKGSLIPLPEVVRAEVLRNFGPPEEVEDVMIYFRAKGRGEQGDQGPTAVPVTP